MRKTIVLALVMCAFQARITMAVTVFTWTGANSAQDHDMSLKGNWAGGAVPKGGSLTNEILVFPPGPTTSLVESGFSGTNAAFQSWAFTGGGYYFWSGGFLGNTMTLGALLNAAGTNEIENTLSFGAIPTISTQTGTTLTIRGSISPLVGCTWAFKPCPDPLPPISLNESYFDATTGVSTDGQGTIRINAIGEGAVIEVHGGVVQFGFGGNICEVECSNRYTGLTTVFGGSLNLLWPGTAINGPLIIGTGDPTKTPIVQYLANDQISDGVDVIVGSNGRLELNGFSDTVHGVILHSGALVGGSVHGTLTLGADPSLVIDSGGATGASVTGNLNLGGTMRTFTVADGTAPVDIDVAAVVSGLGSEGLTKNGPGTLRLGAANSYTGTTTVNAGKLLVDGSVAAVALTSGVLGGTGTTGAVTATGGTIAPGASPGILHTGNASMNGATTFSVEFNGTTAGVQYDQLSVNGTVSLGNAILSPLLGFSPAIGTVFTIIDNDGTDPVSGTFAGIPEGGVLQLGGTRLRVSYVGGTGNDVTATVIAAADLAIVKSTVTTSASINQNVTYTITVANNGPNTATNVTVSDSLPVGAVYVSATANQGSCSGTSTVTCSLGTLNAAASATITLITTTPGFGTSVSNTAAVSAAEFDPNPANNTSTSTYSLAGGIPALSLEALMLLVLALGLAGAWLSTR